MRFGIESTVIYCPVVMLLHKFHSFFHHLPCQKWFVCWLEYQYIEVFLYCNLCYCLFNYLSKQGLIFNLEFIGSDLRVLHDFLLHQSICDFANLHQPSRKTFFHNGTMLDGEVPRGRHETSETSLTLSCPPQNFLSGDFSAFQAKIHIFSYSH